MTTETSATASAESTTESKIETKTAGAAKFSFEELEKYREEAISDNIKLREKNSEYKKQMQQLETQARKGAELEEQLTKVEQQARQRVAKAEFKALLKHSGIDDPDVLKLLPLESVEYDDEGEPSNVEAIWTTFQESKKYLFNAKTNTSTAAIKAAPEPKNVSVDWNTLSDEEFDARRAEMHKAQRRQ